MNNQETINILNGLKLKGMSDAFASMVRCLPKNVPVLKWVSPEWLKPNKCIA